MLCPNCNPEGILGKATDPFGRVDTEVAPEPESGEEWKT